MLLVKLANIFVALADIVVGWKTGRLEHKAVSK
jgi:hypothetical protein